MKTRLTLLLILTWTTVAAAMTYPLDLNVSFEREYPGTHFNVGQVVNVNIRFVTQESTELSSFFYSEQLPNWLRLFPTEVKLNNTPITYQWEQGEQDEILSGYTPYRWILDDPHGSPDLILDQGDRLDLVYRLVANQSGYAAMDHHGWFGFLESPYGGAILGCDDESVVLMFGTASGVPEQAPVAGLLGAWPNPFNPSTTIAFVNDEERRLALAVYDITGRLVRTLLSDSFGEGRHETVWDGRDDTGAPVASGVYSVQLIGREGVLDGQRVVLLK